MRREHKWMSPACVTGVVLSLMLAGCTGTSLFQAGINTLIDSAKSTTLILRVINGTTADIQVTVRVDGVDKELPLCTSIQGTCDYVLSSCPNSVELIQEARYNAADEYVGGRNFEGNADYSFVQGDFQCGGQVIYEFNDSSATGMAF